MEEPTNYNEEQLLIDKVNMMLLNEGLRKVILTSDGFYGDDELIQKYFDHNKDTFVLGDILGYECPMTDEQLKNKEGEINGIRYNAFIYSKSKSNHLFKINFYAFRTHELLSEDSLLNIINKGISYNNFFKKGTIVDNVCIEIGTTKENFDKYKKFYENRGLLDKIKIEHYGGFQNNIPEKGQISALKYACLAALKRLIKAICSFINYLRLCFINFNLGGNLQLWKEIFNSGKKSNENIY